MARLGRSSIIESGKKTAIVGLREIVRGGAGGDAMAVGAVRYDVVQTLSAGEKAQARTNIGVGRRALLSNTTFYVAGTGSDSNDGTSATTAWATTQHAQDVFAQSIDLSGYLATVSIGAGTFAGFGLKPSTGGGIFWKGAGVGTTFLTDGPNDGTYNGGEALSAKVPLSPTINYFDALTLTSNQRCLFVDVGSPGAAIIFKDPVNGGGSVAFTATASLLNYMFVRGNGATVRFLNTNVTVNGHAGNAGFIPFRVEGHGWVRKSTSNPWTILGTINILGGFINGSVHGLWTDNAQQMNAGGATVTGARYWVQGGASVDTGTGLDTGQFFPGSLQGVVVDGGEYI